MLASVVMREFDIEIGKMEIANKFTLKITFVNLS
jgi:hypothetical protein